MNQLASDVLEALKLVAALAGLGLLFLVAGGFLLATYRVAVRGRPLVVPFRGADDRRAELASLFAERLIEIEEGWVRRAAKAVALKDAFHRRSRMAAQPDPETLVTPLSGGQALAGVGTAPRTGGDDFLEYVVELGGANSIADADLGTVSVAGVSFSPQQLVALLRQLPQAFARRLISGTIVKLADGMMIVVYYQEKRYLATSRRIRRAATVKNDDWLAAIETLAFDLEKGRVELRCDRRRERDERRRRIRSALRSPAAEPDQVLAEGDRAGYTASGSETADRALIEAQSWDACEAFLDGYALHLQHYLSGKASDREQALEAYTRALGHQPGYARAHYNRATLLYNRYLVEDNEQAIRDFKAAATTTDSKERALALAGLVMAYGQAVHRFDVPAAQVTKDARRASDEALELAPQLEEGRFARAWALQIDRRWESAIEAYEAVTTLAGEPTPPGERMKSFAENNAAWILLNELLVTKTSLKRAERLLWQAVRRYPNKIAYANLADVAKRWERYDDAERLFECALALDPDYVKGWHELALLQLDRAAQLTRDGDLDSAKRFVTKARGNQARAKRITKDAKTRKRLSNAFDEKLRSVTAQPSPHQRRTNRTLQKQAHS